jgi:glycosyltransferase involved in cell wall biosynthesis
LYSAADVVLSLSRAETFGLTIVEGMACGTPAIVYERTALPELITDTTGVVVKNVGDIDSVCAAIETIAQNGKDYYSAACRKRAEEYFDKDKCFNQYLELYRELLKNK